MSPSLTPVSPSPTGDWDFPDDWNQTCRDAANSLAAEFERMDFDNGDEMEVNVMGSAGSAGIEAPSQTEAVGVTDGTGGSVLRTHDGPDRKENFRRAVIDMIEHAETGALGQQTPPCPSCGGTNSYLTIGDRWTCSDCVTEYRDDDGGP